MTDMDPASAPKPPMPADTRALGAIGEMFQDSGDERQVPRRASVRGRCGTGRPSRSTPSS
jgi:hypothetical protein